jgi:hypothetical protein
MSEKICESCGNPSPFESFRRRKDGTGRITPFCKTCRNMRKRYRTLYVKYNITGNQMEQMFVLQSGKCAICGEEFKDARSINVDHNHKTGQVRQLLCRGCNYGIGFLRENTETLQKAINYLNKWSTPSL